MRWLFFFIGWLIFYLYQLVNSLFHLDALAFVLWLVLGGIGTWVISQFTQIGMEGGFKDKKEKVVYHEELGTKKNSKKDASWGAAVGIITVLVTSLIVISWIVQDYTKTSTQYSTGTQNTETSETIDQFGEPENQTVVIPSSMPTIRLNSTYPTATRIAFLTSCYQSAEEMDTNLKQSYCSCLLGYLESNYTLYEFAQLEATYKQTQQFSPDVINAAKSCVDIGNPN